MDSMPVGATQKCRYDSHDQIPNEHIQVELKNLSSYPQPLYAPREPSDPAPSHWTPSAWQNTGLPTTSALNSSLNLQCPSHNEPWNAFDMAFQLPAPWTSLSSSIPNGVSGNVSLPFQAYGSTFVNRTSPAMISPIIASALLNSSRGDERSAIEINDDDDADDEDKEEPDDTITLERRVTAPKASAMHKVAWALSSRRESERKSLAHPTGSKGSVNGRCTPRRSSSKETTPSTKSGSDADSNTRSKGRLNHDLTEKRYRKRLNFQFENLLSALPAHLIAEAEGSNGGPDDRREKRISKAEVLTLARSHIELLERKQGELEGENRQLAALVKGMEERWRGLGYAEMRLP